MPALVGGESLECGDAVKHDTEECDDGNILNRDGCSDSCTVEEGWSCETLNAISECEEDCGDGFPVGSETCDDGNVEDGDGCDKNCQAEEGW